MTSTPSLMRYSLSLPSLCSGVLKDYLRELPYPLITKQLYEAVLESMASRPLRMGTAGCENDHADSEHTTSLLENLPEVERVRRINWHPPFESQSLWRNNSVTKVVCERGNCGADNKGSDGEITVVGLLLRRLFALGDISGALRLIFAPFVCEEILLFQTSLHTNLPRLFGMIFK